MDKKGVEIGRMYNEWKQQQNLNNAGGRPLLGLKKRRAEEANMFLGRETYYVDSLGNIKKK